MAIATKPKANRTLIPALAPKVKKSSAAKKTKLAADKPAAKKTKPVTAMPVRTASRPVAQSAIETTVQPQAAKPVKPKKPKLVRDSFTIPKAEYTVLDDLKQRAARLASPAKKSELLRAGIKALAAMPDAAFLTALGAVPTIKTGRPNKT